MITGLSGVRSVIIRVIAKLEDRPAGVRFVCHEYHYRQNWMTRSLITILEWSSYERKGKFALKTDEVSDNNLVSELVEKRSSF